MQERSLALMFVLATLLFLDVSHSSMRERKIHSFPVTTIEDTRAW